RPRSAPPAAVEHRRVAAGAQEVHLDGAQQGIGRDTAREEREGIPHQGVDLGAGFAPQDHAVGQVEHVAPGAESVDVGGEGAQRLDEPAAEQEDEVRRRALAEHHPHVHERLECAREPSLGVLRPLGDARHLAVLLGDERDDAVRLPVGASAEHEGRGGDLVGHERVTALVPSRPFSRNRVDADTFVLARRRGRATESVLRAPAPAAHLRRVPADDREHRRQAAAEAADWQQVHPLSLEAIEDKIAAHAGDHYVNTRFTGDPRTDWVTTIARWGAFRRGLVLGTSSPRREIRLLETNPELHVTLLDISEGAGRRRAQALAAQFPGRVQPETADLNFVRLAPERYDLIVSSSTIHHVTNLEYLAFQINRALAPEG